MIQELPCFPKCHNLVLANNPHGHSEFKNVQGQQGAQCLTKPCFQQVSWRIAGKTMYVYTMSLST